MFCFILNYLKRLYFLDVINTTVPSSAQIISSLTATLKKVKPKVIIVAVPSVKNTVKIPTASPFKTVGGMAARTGIALIFSFPMRLIKTADSRVATVPNIISTMPNGLEILDSRQPIVRPGMAAGVIAASMLRASESLN